MGKETITNNMQNRPVQTTKKNGRKRILFVTILGIVGAVFVSINMINGLSQNASQPTTKIESNAKASDEEKWCLILVNKWNPILPKDSNIETVLLPNGERVDKRIYPYLKEMFDAARTAGVYPIVASGYRTEQEQQQIYDDKFSAYKAEGLSEAKAQKETELWVARPGTSEHQSGLAVDINADGIHSKGTEVYRWLKDNAHLYGFINRYPANKTNITGVANEPWHYRYVGVKAATEIRKRKICLEEYLKKIN